MDKQVKFDVKCDDFCKHNCTNCSCCSNCSTSISINCADYCKENLTCNAECKGDNKENIPPSPVTQQPKATGWLPGPILEQDMKIRLAALRDLDADISALRVPAHGWRSDRYPPPRREW